MAAQDKIGEVEDELIADFSHQLHPDGIRSLPWLLELPEPTSSESDNTLALAPGDQTRPKFSARIVSGPIVRPPKDKIEELDLTHNNLKSLEGIEDFSSLRILCLRQNLLTALQDLGPCTASLQSLDLYLNSLRDLLPGLHLPRLLHFDASYNKITDLTGLEQWTTLRTLYLASNRIAELPVSIFSALSGLRTLELGNNRLRNIGPALSNLPHLEELFLGKNKLTEISGLEFLTSLTRLDLQSNRIVKLGDGLSKLTQLRELYISHNGITEIDDGLSTLVNLECLDLSSNMISRLENLSTLVNLQEFWFSRNKISSFADVEQLANSTKLHTVYFEHNPIATDPQYRSRVGLALPTLTQIDADLAYPQQSALARATKLVQGLSDSTN